MAKTLLSHLALYNRWANARIYAAALELPDEAYRRNVGVYFESLHGTLNHLLVTDRIWLKRLTGEGPSLEKLDAIVFVDLAALWGARRAEDDRIIALVDGASEAELGSPYQDRVSGKRSKSTLAELLAHLFNHQTHHRGQAHTCFSLLDVEPPALDLLKFQAGRAAPAVKARPWAGSTRPDRRR